jgi:hypothetical protein
VALSRAPERSAGPKARPLRSHRAAQTGGVRGAREIGMDELFARAGFLFKSSPKRQRWKWNPRRCGAPRRCSGRSDSEARSGRRGTPKFKISNSPDSHFSISSRRRGCGSCGNPEGGGERGGISNRRGKLRSLELSTPGQLPQPTSEDVEAKREIVTPRMIIG